MFWEIYSRLCKSKGKSANAVAKELSIASGTVTEWKRGRMPQNMTLRRIADYFDVSVEYLLGKEETNRAETVPVPCLGLRVPVYDGIRSNELVELAGISEFAPTFENPWKTRSDCISAGIPLALINDGREYEEIPKEMAGTDQFVAVRLQDDSMEPRMRKGDVAIVRIQLEPIDGETVIAFAKDVDHAICRQVKTTPEGLLLIATNPKYEPIFCSQQQLASMEARILGRVVELRAKF